MSLDTYNARPDMRNPKDIHFVTVHGICGNSDSSKTNDSEKTEPPWLEKFVAKQYSGNWITNFRYSLDVESRVLTSELNKVADDLLNETKEPRLKEGRPLVIISHDIGGLIVKQALLNAIRHEAFSYFAERTIVLVFIGTPQRATASESWEEIALKLVLRAHNASICSISRVQEQLAHTLMEVSDNFLTLSRMYSFVSFYEKNPHLSLALTSFSDQTSRLNISKETTGSIDRDAVEDINDGFTKLVNYAIGKAAVVDTSYVESFRTLSMVDGENALTFSRKAPIPQHEDALKWVLNTKTFERWSNSSCWLLWLYGQFSSDLSASLSAVEKAGFADFKYPSVIKFSFSSQYDRHSSTYKMLASLSHQLLLLRPELFDHVRQLHEKISQDLPWRVDQLWVLFRSLLLCPEHGVTICIIDKIDECDKTQNQYLTDLLDLPESTNFTGSFKLIVTSHRPPSDEYKSSAVIDIDNEDIEQSEDTNKSTKINEDGDQAGSLGRNTHVEIEASTTLGKHAREQKDLVAVFDSEISHLLRAKPELLKFKDIVKSKIRTTTNELSASLTLTLLEARQAYRTYSLLQSELQSIPATLFELYGHFMDRIPQEHLIWTRKVMSWMMNAYRPLKLAELAVALCLEKEVSSTSDLRTILSQNLAFDIQQSFGNLITIQNETVSFVHVSFQEFLFKDRWISPNPNRICLDSSENLTVTLLRRTFHFDDHAIMAEVCLKYMTLMSKQWRQETDLRGSKEPPEYMLLSEEEQYAFLAYAIKYWYRHYNAASHRIYPSLQGIALKFLQDPDCLQFWQGLDWSLASTMKKARSSVNSPLLVAVQLHCCDLVRELLGKGQDSKYLSLALKSAIEGGDDEIIDALKAAGAKHEEELHLATLHGRNKLLSRLLEDFHPSVSLSTSPFSPLHLASTAGHHLFISWLIDAGFDENEKTRDGAGMTSLHIASQFGHLLVIKALLEKGADVTAHNEDNRTALHVACEWQQASVVIRLLGSGVDIDSVSRDGRTALHLAAESGRKDIVEYLLDFLKHTKEESDSLMDALHFVDDRHATALHLAASNGHVEVVRQLLSCMTNSHHAISMQDLAKNTPLHLAARKGHFEVVEALLYLEWKDQTTDDDENPPLSSISIENNEGQLPIHLAVCSGSVSTVYHLADAHEDKHVSLDASDEGGYSPLHLATRYGFAVISSILIWSGAQVDITDLYSMTPLHVACENGHLETVKRLLQLGADEICTDSRGRSALHHATASGVLEVVKALFQSPTKQADYVNSRDNTGSTALHISAQDNNIDITEFLLSQDADVTVSDSGGHSALYRAAKKQNTSIMYRLLKEIKKTSNKSTSTGEMLEVVQVLLEAIPGDSSSDDGGARPDDKTPGNEAPKDGSSNEPTENEEKRPGWYSDEILDALPDELDVEYKEQYETIFRLAAQIGEYKVVEKILKLRKTDSTGAIDLNAGNASNQTALSLAAMKGRTKIVELLLTFPEIINKCDSKDKSMRSPLSYAAEIGNLEVVQFLIFCHQRPSLESETYREALSCAAKRGHDRIVSLLLFDVTLPAPAENEGPLFDGAFLEAASGTHMEIVKLLLERGANIDAADDEGFTALHLATQAGNLETVKHLLETRKIKNLDVCSTKRHQTALYLASWAAKKDIVDLLIKHGADTEVPDVLGWRPLHAAYDSIETVQVLVNKAEIDSRTDRQETPMYIAMSRGYATVAMELLKHGAESFTRTKYGVSPLHEAVSIKTPELLKEMVESAAKIDGGTTAVGEIAMECDDIELINLALEQGIDKNEIDKHGWSFEWTKYVLLVPVDERPEPPQASETTFKVPTKWSSLEKSNLLVVLGDEGLKLKYELPAGKDPPPTFDVGTIRANHPIPPIGKFVFELEILEEGTNGEIAIGFGHKLSHLNRMPGWDPTSWGYHGDDGKKYHARGSGVIYGKTFGKGQKVSCHIDQSKGTAYFEIDGERQSDPDMAFTNITGRLYPMVGMKSSDAVVKATFIWESPDTPLATEQALEGKLKTDDAGDIVPQEEPAPNPTDSASVLEVAEKAIASIQHLSTVLEDVQKASEAVEAIKLDLRSVELVLRDLKGELSDEVKTFVGIRLGELVKKCELVCQNFEERFERRKDITTEEVVGQRVDQPSVALEERRLKVFSEQLRIFTRTFSLTVDTVSTLRFVSRRHLLERRKYRMLRIEVETIGQEILETFADVEQKREYLQHFSDDESTSRENEEELSDIRQQLAVYEARQIMLEDLLRQVANEQMDTEVKSITVTVDKVVITIDFKGTKKEWKIGESGFEETADDQDLGRSFVRRRTGAFESERGTLL